MMRRMRPSMMWMRLRLRTNKRSKRRIRAKKRLGLVVLKKTKTPVIRREKTANPLLLCPVCLAFGHPSLRSSAPHRFCLLSNHPKP